MSLDKLLAVAAALVSAGAGIYLIGNSSAASGETVFDVLMDGIGAYFIAKGMWMLARTFPAAPKGPTPPSRP